MLDRIINDFISQDYSHELDSSVWLNYSAAATLESDQQKRNAFIKALTTHTGVPESLISTTFEVLTNLNKSQTERNEALMVLNKSQLQTTAKILSFKQHQFFKTLNLDKLSITRSHWNLLITRFEQQKRKNITDSFFQINLSAIQNVNISQLITAMRKPQPGRGVKRERSFAPRTPNAKRPCLRTPIADGGETPFIFSSGSKTTKLETDLAASGVRIVGKLEDTSPVKGVPGVKQTPGGSKARPVCDINGLSFFKPITPDRLMMTARTQEEIRAALPKLKSFREKPVEFVATLAPIKERSGMKRRYSALTLTGASAADVFREYGVEIKPKDSHSYHWYHLIAHFLTGEEHLVPATAAANYNLLDAVELFIRNKLVNTKTQQVHISVAPQYSDENIIPDVIIYNISWKEKKADGSALDCKETFNINPQSYYRFTKSALAAIERLRKERQGEDEDEDEEPVIKVLDFG